MISQAKVVPWGRFLRITLMDNPIRIARSAKRTIVGRMLNVQ